MNLSSKQWNQGNVNQNPFAMQREQASHQVHIDAPVTRVFERACLAGQPGWMRAGSMRLSYSEGGRDERHALWSESATGPALFRQPQLETFWTTTRLDPERHRYQAALVNPELAMGTLDVSMEEEGEGTVVSFDLSYTVLSEAGSVLFDDGLGARMDRLLDSFGHTLEKALSRKAAPVTLAPHQARRQGARYEGTINGEIDDCFTLACPVAELKWIDDWHFDLVYSESGRNETGCVFLEPGSGISMLRVPGANNYWYVTRYDGAQHCFEAVWVTRDLTIAHWELRMTDLGGGQTRVDWSLVYTGLSEEGSRIISEPGLDTRMRRALEFLATSLKRYVETGTLYRLSSHRKLRVAASLVGAALGRHLRGQSGHHAERSQNDIMSS